MQVKYILTLKALNFTRKSVKYFFPTSNIARDMLKRDIEV